MTFKMPTDPNLVKNFVYKLGAGRFDELLAAEVEENVRTFVNSHWLSKVFDLKAEMGEPMLQ